MALDRVLAEQMGITDPQFPAFEANGRRMSAVHADCKVETYQRLCPHCHSRLPVRFGHTDSQLIALVGAKESGKTVYMTVLVHELLNDVGSRLHLSLLGADEHTRTTFGSEYESRLYDKGELAGTTVPAASHRGRRKAPLVFSLSKGSGARRTKVRHTVLSFFDTAGEDLTTQSSVDEHVRYLANADGIILLLDPLQMRGGRDMADPEALLPSTSVATDTQTNVLARIIELLRSTGGNTNKPINKPIAVGFSKMDALLSRLPKNSPLHRRPPTKAGFDEADSMTVHQYMRALLRDLVGHNLDDTLANNFIRHRYFGFSGLGRSPVLDEERNVQRVADGVPRPWRVEDPLLWLLSEFRMIPRVGKPTGGQ